LFVDQAGELVEKAEFLAGEFEGAKLLVGEIREGAKPVVG
jgi:hypothetical protein